MESILKEAKGRYRILYALLAGCGPLRAGEALGLEIDKHVSEDCRTLYVRQKAKRGIIQKHLIHWQAHFRTVVLHMYRKAASTNGCSQR